MTPELIGILAMSATLAGLMVAIWRDARAHANRGLAELRAEIRDQRADIQSLRQEVGPTSRTSVKNPAPT